MYKSIIKIKKKPVNKKKNQLILKNLLPIGKNSQNYFQNLITKNLLKTFEEDWVLITCDLIKKNAMFKDEKYEKFLNLKALKKKKNYRAHRLKNKLPLRGQRTHTNAKTRKVRNVK